MLKRIFFLLSICSVLSLQLVAQQEELNALKYNPQMRLLNANASLNAAKFQSVGDTLSIPFIDDFSSTQVYPDSSKWLDRNVFINSDFPMNPPTIGVATFDGLDSLGNAYDNSTASIKGLCDVLTSKPINLYSDAQGNLYQLSDSIWLTFFVERKGKGRQPGLNDSLIVEFYDRDSLKWTQVWSEKGTAIDTVFTKIKIPVVDLKWFDTAFQFRFKNYGPKTGALAHWHIDYVTLQRNFFPYDNNINDIAFRYKSPTFLNDYTSVPWNHFMAANQASLIKSNLLLEAYNNNNNAPINVRFTDAIYQGNMSNQILSHDGGSNNVNQNQDTVYSYPLAGLAIAPTTNHDETFYMMNKMSNQFTGGGQDNIRSNDSIVTKQVFRSYYSYDDGTAEAGYTITNTANAKIAMRFDLLQSDTIRAVQIFFVQQYDNSSSYQFRLGIWSSITPENLIYQRTSLTPDYIDSINGFATYTIPDTILILSGSVYIGLTCNLAKDYDLGFDFNTDSKPKMFYNTTGSWVNTTFHGTFMIRPVFGDSAIFAGIHEPSKNNDDGILMYPNPAHDKIYFSSTVNESFTAQFFDNTGRKVNEQKIVNNMTDISTLQKGFYLVRLTDKTSKKVYTKKLVVN